MSLCRPRLAIFTMIAGLTLSSCVSSKLTESTDYALAVGHPYPNETSIGQERVTNYLRRLSPGKRAKVEQYGNIAVEAASMPVSDVPGLSARITKDQSHSLGALGGNLYDRLSVMVKFVLIFDSKTGRQATEDGFVVMDTPAKGQAGMFGGFTAVYIGNGR